MIDWRWGLEDEQVELLRDLRESSGRKLAITSSNYLEFIGSGKTPSQQNVIEFLWGYLPLYHKSHREPLHEAREELSDLIAFLASKRGFDPEPLQAICQDEDIFETRWRSLGLVPIAHWLEELRSMLELRGLGSTIPPLDPDDDFGRLLEGKVELGFDVLLFPELAPADDPRPEVVEAAAGCQALAYLRSLLEIIGAGTRLTAKGHLNLTDGRALAEAIGCGFLFDEKIGDRVFKTRSSSDIEPLELTFEWAKAAGLVRVQHGKLLPTRKGRRFGKDPLEDWWGFFSTAVEKLNWARRRFGEEAPFWADLVADCGASYLRAVMDAAGRGVALLPLAYGTWRLVEERWVVEDLTDEQVSFQRSHISSVIRRGALRPIELLGAVETWEGAAHGAARMLPIGDWALRRLAEELREQEEEEPEEFPLSGVIDLRQWRIRTNGSSSPQRN